MKIKIPFFTKCLLSLIFWFSFNSFSYAQRSTKNDVILTNKKVKIQAIILQSDSSLVKYKKATDPDGPMFIIRKSEILSIIKSNGDIDSISPDKRAVGLEKMASTDSHKLRVDYALFRRKAARYKNMGYIGVFTGLLLTGGGVAILSHQTKKYQNSNGSFFIDDPASAMGIVFFTAGLGAGIPLTITGFVKNKRYTRRAVDVQNELRRRTKPLSFRLNPGYNPVANSAHLSLKLTF